jgi:hypothetical protein
MGLLYLCVTEMQTLNLTSMEYSVLFVLVVVVIIVLFESLKWWIKFCGFVISWGCYEISMKQVTRSRAFQKKLDSIKFL